MCFHRTLFRWLHIRDGSIMQPMSVILKSHILFCTKRTVPNVHQRSFVYYTNNFYLAAKDIALLYKYRWQVELFFKWIKQHLQVKRFWGESENAVRIQVHVAIITYCLIAIIEHDLKIGRPVFEVMRILGKSALTTDSIQDLLKPLKETAKPDDGQLYFDFKFD